MKQNEAVLSALKTQEQFAFCALEAGYALLAQSTKVPRLVLRVTAPCTALQRQLASDLCCRTYSHLLTGHVFVLHCCSEDYAEEVFLQDA